MGFNVVALAQKARTQTLIVDSDLNMGNYDLIATDVKGDTAEFSEFVGGVGNFTSGLFSGGVDVSGILHAEGNTQVDGNIILEGSINNVNIADDGEITTTKGVNGADFNGATITATKFNGATIDSAGNVTGAKLKQTSPYTVVAGSVPSAAGGGSIDSDSMLQFLLPYNPAKYTGTITVKSYVVNNTIYYKLGLNGTISSTTLGNGASFNITFTNTEQVIIWNGAPSDVPKTVISNIELS